MERKKLSKTIIDSFNLLAFGYLTNMVYEMELVPKAKLIIPKTSDNMNALSATWLKNVRANLPRTTKKFDELLSGQMGQDVQVIFGCIMAGLVAFDCLLQEHGHTAWDIIQGFRKDFEKLYELEVANQSDKKALRKLKHPHRSKKLKSFVEE